MLIRTRVADRWRWLRHPLRELKWLAARGELVVHWTPSPAVVHPTGRRKKVPVLAAEDQVEGLVPDAREYPVAEHVGGRAEGLAERLESDALPKIKIINIVAIATKSVQPTSMRATAISS